MAITYPLTFPTQGIVDIIFRGSSITSVSRSPFTGQEQVQRFQGQLWGATVAYPAMKRANAEEVISFLLKLYGRFGTFLMGDPNGATPRGEAGGTPLVDGASQTGDTLAIKGATVGQSNWLRAGDYISLGSGVNTHLHKVLTDANTDSIGDVTVDIWPELRTSPANNDPVTVSSCKGLFRLASNLTEFSIDVATIYGIEFECIESIQV